MILDSSFLIDLMDQDAGVVAKTGGIDRDQLTVPTLVCTEVGTGFDAGSSQAEAFEAMVADVTLAPYDAEAPRHAVSIRRQLSGQGRHIGAVDTMIAGTSAGITTRKQEPRTSISPTSRCSECESRAVVYHHRRAGAGRASGPQTLAAGVRYEQSRDAQHRRQPAVVGHAG